jgi:hypothetical protein
VVALPPLMPLSLVAPRSSLHATDVAATPTMTMINQSESSRCRFMCELRTAAGTKLNAERSAFRLTHFRRKHAELTLIQRW